MVAKMMKLTIERKNYFSLKEANMFAFYQNNFCIVFTIVALYIFILLPAL